MRTVTRFILLYITATFSALGAPDVPPEPRLVAAPASSAWTIQVQYKPTPPPSTPLSPDEAAQAEWVRQHNPRIVAMQVTKSGENKRVVFQYEDQSQSTSWIVGGTMIYKKRQSKILAVSSMHKPSGMPFMQDFDLLDWIEKASYKGHEPFHGVDCCTYTTTVPGKAGGQTAYIDAQTGLPVAVDQGDVTLIYTFKASNERVEVPPEVTAQLKAFGRHS